MAPAKRTAAAAATSEPRKKRRKEVGQSDPTAVRESGARPSKETTDGHRRNNASQKERSVLQEEERAFPRGGGSALTPLEQKQIQAQATRDVLFEQSGSKKARRDSLEDSEAEATAENERKPSKKRRRAKSGTEKQDVGEKEAKVKIEGLSFKRLVVGSVVLGQVQSITAREAVLALPNNIVGYVPIMQISDQVSARIEKLLDEEEDTEMPDQDKPEDFDDVDLKSLLRVGQYLRAAVISTEDDANSKSGAKSSRRKIQLSIHPRDVNQGLATSDLAVGITVSASVRSVEDHGLVMDLGLGGASAGFLSFKELGPVEEAQVEVGMVFLCLVTSISDDQKILKLSGDPAKLGSLKKSTFVTQTPTVDSLLPGTAVEVLVTESSVHGVAGKIMGMVDATADLIHAGAGAADIAQSFPVGSKVKARIVCTFPASHEQKVGVSLLAHVLHLSSASGPKKAERPDAILPISSIIEEGRVTRVRPGVGLFMDLGIDGVPGFAHISRLSDSKVDTISDDTGPYKIGSTHRARVVGYNAIDGLFLLSLEEKVLSQPFLRIEDLKVGQLVQGKVEKIVVNDRGVGGILVNLTEGISGLVPEMHMADVHLQHPERKFREGLAVTARVLSTDLDRRLIRLTLKKTLLNSEAEPWTTYDHIEEGSQSLGTIVNILPTGAVVQFYGRVRAFLPIAEMSDSFIQDPAQHFRVGQVVSVRAIEIYPEESKMTVTCRDLTLGAERLSAFEAVKVGTLVNGTISEKSEEDVTVTLDAGDLRASLSLEQLSDGSRSKNAVTLKRLRAGQKLQGLLVLEKRPQRHLIGLTNKPSLVKAAQARTLICAFEDVLEDKDVQGFVRNITSQGVYVQFAGGIVGLLLKSQLDEASSKMPEFGLRLGQSISCRVLSVDHSQRRFLLTQRAPGVPTTRPDVSSTLASPALVNPVDGVSTSIADFSFGKATKARITGVKETQLNVQLADNLQGRVDVSEIFGGWEEIKDRKRPLMHFKPKQVIDVRVLGVHDARNHRFLPISHRTGKVPVFELSMQDFSTIQNDSDVLTLDKIKQGSEWLAFVNNISDRCLWVNLSPNVCGRIDMMDLTDDISLLSNVPESFPIGSALKVVVKHIELSSNKLDLASAALTGTKPTSFPNVAPGMVLPGRVTKVTEHQLVIQLSESVTGVVGLTDLADDYEQANPTVYNKNDVVRVCVTEVDAANKRVFLSLRPSKVLSSALPVKDPQITRVTDVKANDIVRGFVKNVAEQGLFVALSPRVTAFVRISDLSDAYIKDWKAAFEVDQLVKGKVLTVDESLNHVQMSLKASLLDKNYVPPLTLSTLKVGQVVTGKVRKVEDYGVFVLVDNSNNLSGLCHRSEIADGPVGNVRNLYSEGDRVKARVLKIDLEKRRVNFGLKASYLQNEETDAGLDGEDEDDMRLVADQDSEDDSRDGGIAVSDADVADSDTDMDSVSESGETEEPSKRLPGLSAGAFDWSGDIEQPAGSSAEEDSETGEDVEVRKKKRRKPEIKVDRTGDLDKYGPRSVADFERQLLGQPNSSSLWIQYMAFQLKLNEVDRAREIATRALNTIHIREEDEKLNVWVALLNLENAYGSDETLDDAFKRACQYNDTQEIHQRLASTYIDSGKHEKADELFQAMTKNKSIAPDKAFWINYATFLITTLGDAPRARALLPRAMQSVAQQDHLRLTSGLGALEFTSPNGDPERGRTVFEGILSSFPSRGDLWDMFVDLEKAHGDADNARGLFERMAGQKLKKRRANFVFRRWAEFEESQGDAQAVQRIEALARQWSLDHKKTETSEQ